MMQAIRSTRKGGHVSYVGVPHGVELKGEELFYTHVHLHGGPAPVRRYLPKLIDLVLNKKINPGKVFDLTLPLDRWPRATARWTSAARSRHCAAAPVSVHRAAARGATVQTCGRTDVSELR
jgi:threonine dehydrogenase-like Zn-dependent dehydrogenase